MTLTLEIPLSSSFTSSFVYTRAATLLPEALVSGGAARVECTNLSVGGCYPGPA